MQAQRAQRCGSAWLFGSFVWGRPTENSDVDLLVDACADPDGLATDLWRALDRAVHVVTVQAAPSSLLQRVFAEGKRL